MLLNSGIGAVFGDNVLCGTYTEDVQYNVYIIYLTVTNQNTFLPTS
jgi:hypothetical protein